MVYNLNTVEEKESNKNVFEEREKERTIDFGFICFLFIFLIRKNRAPKNAGLLFLHSSLIRLKKIISKPFTSAFSKFSFVKFCSGNFFAPTQSSHIFSNLISAKFLIRKIIFYISQTTYMLAILPYCAMDFKF